MKESDWKIFRQLHGVALERFCERVIEEVRSSTASCTDSHHDCYLKLFDLLRRRDKELGDTFDTLRRSNALFLLVCIKRRGLLTEEELMRLSAETREAVEKIESISRD